MENYFHFQVNHFSNNPRQGDALNKSHLIDYDGAEHYYSGSFSLKHSAWSWYI